MNTSHFPPIRLTYYFCPDPTDVTEQIEVQELLKLSTHCFIFMPHNTDFNALAEMIPKGTCHTCLWSVKSENDAEKVLALYKNGTLSEKTWGDIGAKRICFTPMQWYIEDENTLKSKDWITGEWMQAGSTPVS